MFVMKAYAQQIKEQNMSTGIVLCVPGNVQTGGGRFHF